MIHPHSKAKYHIFFSFPLIINRCNFSLQTSPLPALYFIRLNANNVVKIFYQKSTTDCTAYQNIKYVTHGKNEMKWKTYKHCAITSSQNTVWHVSFPLLCSMLLFFIYFYFVFFFLLSIARQPLYFVHSFIMQNENQRKAKKKMKL